MEEKRFCYCCGTELTEESAREFDGQFFCRECLEDQTVTCDNCGDRIWRDSAEGDSFYTLCHDCYTNCYTRCEDCGRLVHDSNVYYFEGDDYPYCRDCFDRLNGKAIKNYSYKPEPIFYGEGPLFLGVELEIDKGGEDSHNAQTLLDIANADEEKIYCKHDGSLNDGFEIVSHPMSLDYHINNMFQEFLSD